MNPCPPAAVVAVAPVVLAELLQAARTANTAATTTNRPPRMLPKTTGLVGAVQAGRSPASGPGAQSVGGHPVHVTPPLSVLDGSREIGCRRGRG
jgi:hypothetical protein